MCRRRAPRCSPGRRSRSRSSARQLEFSKLLVEKADIAVSPGIGFGEYGEGYVRIALVENEQRIRQAARNVRRFLETAPEKLHNVVPLATAALSILTDALMAASESGCRRIGHGRRRPGRPDRAPARGAQPCAAGGASRSSAVSARSRAKDRGVDLPRLQLVLRSGRARALARHRRVRRTDRRRRRSGQERGRGGARRRQIGGHRQQGAARQARRRARRARREAPAPRSISRPRSAAASRSSRPARGARRQLDRAHLRHPQRHLQLHPHPHGAGRACPSPNASKEAQRLGYAEADPTFDIEGYDTAQKLAILAASPSAPRSTQRAIYVEGISSITPADLDAADELGYRVKLLGVAVRTDKGIEQRVHPTMVRKDSAIAQVDGRDQCGHHRCRRHRSADPGRAGRRRRGHRLGGGLRHRRHRARRARRAVRPAGGAARQRCARRRCSATRAATTSACRRATGRAPRRPSPRAWPSRRFRWNRSCSATGPQARRRSTASGGAVPVILITYATTEDAVRKALAAVGRDRVISGRPQVIRIEKN